MFCIMLSATVPLGTPGRVRSIFWWSDVWNLSVSKGPPACFSRYSQTLFWTFFWVSFLMTCWNQMVPPRDPKIAQNHQKSCSRGLPESTLQKVTKNYAIWKGQTSEFADTYTLSAVFPVAQGPQKGAQKPPKMEPLGTQNHRENRKTNTQKTHQKMDAKTIKKGAKKDYSFRAEKSPKSQKSEPWAQNVPQASRRGSQAPKILKNHQKWAPKSLEILRIW